MVRQLAAAGHPLAYLARCDLDELRLMTTRQQPAPVHVRQVCLVGATIASMLPAPELPINRYPQEATTWLHTTRQRQPLPFNCAVVIEWSASCANAISDILDLANTVKHVIVVNTRPQCGLVNPLQGAGITTIRGPVTEPQLSKLVSLGDV